MHFIACTPFSTFYVRFPWRHDLSLLGLLGGSIISIIAGIAIALLGIPRTHARTHARTHRNSEDSWAGC